MLQKENIDMEIMLNHRKDLKSKYKNGPERKDVATPKYQ